MRIKITEIEANAEELRNSNSLATNLTNLMRSAFAPSYSTIYRDDENDENDEDMRGEEHD